jgi:hypothetical protein
MDPTLLEDKCPTMVLKVDLIPETDQSQTKISSEFLQTSPLPAENLPTWVNSLMRRKRRRLRITL